MTRCQCKINTPWKFLLSGRVTFSWDNLQGDTIGTKECLRRKVDLHILIPSTLSLIVTFILWYNWFNQITWIMELKWFPGKMMFFKSSNHTVLLIYSISKFNNFIETHTIKHAYSVVNVVLNWLTVSRIFLLDIWNNCTLEFLVQWILPQIPGISKKKIFKLESCSKIDQWGVILWPFWKQ